MTESTTSAGLGEQFTGQDAIYYQRLVDLRDQYIDQVQALSDHALRSNRQAGEELADVGSDNFIREMELDLLTEEGRKIQLLQDAVKRLSEGEYGLCEAEECDKADRKIEEMRLEAIPWARLCLACKRKQEEALR